MKKTGEGLARALQRLQQDNVVLRVGIIESATYPDGEYGKDAITHYKVLKRKTDFDIVECILETGRTHQIRVHFAYLGHSLLSDTLYGTSSSLINRQALHAYKVEFTHPLSKKKVKYIATVPEDLNKLMENA